MKYAVIVNTPGYLADSDPIICDTMEEARQVAQEEAERIEEQDYELPQGYGLAIVSRNYDSGDYWLDRDDDPHSLGLHVSVHELSDEEAADNYPE